MKIIKLISCMLLAVLMLAGCKKETTNIESLFNQAAELSTVQYTVQTIHKGYDSNFWEDNYIYLYSLKSYIKAGIDLTKFDEEDVSINKKEKSIKITLPQPEIFTYNIPSNEIKEEWHTTRHIGHLENIKRDTILQQAEADIRKNQKLESQILKDAEANARTFFKLLLMQTDLKK